MKKKTSKTDQDRRKRTRIPLTKTLKHSTYQVLGTPVFQESPAIDLSSGGISFETTHSYQPGNLILLDMDLGAGTVRLLVAVAWVKKVETGFQVGAELVAIDPEEKRHLQSQLARMIRQAEDRTEVRKPLKKLAKKIPKKKPAKKLAKKAAKTRKK
jgi:hypothetical protein